MRIYSFLMVLLFPILSHTQLALNCDNDSSGLIPLTDLGTGTYEGIMGGLYPDGSNTRPLIHEQKGVEISQTLEPIDTLGNVNYADGKILFIGMGGSNASNCYNMFIDTMKEYQWPGTNPCMQVKGLFFGGKDLHDMIDTTSTFYWDEIQGRLFNREDTWEQIQVVWMLEQSEYVTSDINEYLDYVSHQYTVLLQRMLDSMPNLKIVYFSGFHYTGYTHPDHQLYEFLVEPNGYWGNLAIKEVIARQIAGDPELAFEGPERKVPYINWGPYFWADGVNPRGGDYLTWPCEDYRDDNTGGGFHLEEIGKYKEAKMLMNFFDMDTVANWWYKDDARWSSCGEDTTGSLELILPEFENGDVIVIDELVDNNLDKHINVQPHHVHTVLPPQSSAPSSHAMWVNRNAVASEHKSSCLVNSEEKCSSPSWPHSVRPSERCGFEA